MQKIPWLKISLSTVYSYIDTNLASFEVYVYFNNLPWVNVLYRLTVYHILLSSLCITI